MFRIRDKEVLTAAARDQSVSSTGGNLRGGEIVKTTVFYNCYVFYRQQTVVPPKTVSDPYLVQQAIILVSRWPFPHFAYMLLRSIDQSLFDVALCASKTAKESSGAGSTSTSALVPVNAGGIGWDFDVDSITNVFSVGYANIQAWPEASPGKTAKLQWYGTVREFNVASTARDTYGANMSFDPVFSSINLISKLAPLGLLQHLDALWEVLVKGQDILVLAPNPKEACELVLVLASLLLPMTKYSDFRPYLPSNDSDCAVIATAAKKKLNSPTKAWSNENIQRTTRRETSMIIGICDPALLQMFEDFSVVIFVASSAAASEGVDISVKKPSAAASMEERIYKGMRAKNAAELCRLLPSKSAGKLSRINSSFSKSSYTSFIEVFNFFISVPLLTVFFEANAFLFVFSFLTNGMSPTSAPLYCERI
jgi:hypothetical protein